MMFRFLTMANALRLLSPGERKADEAIKVTANFCYLDGEDLYCNKRPGKKTMCVDVFGELCDEVKNVLKGEESDQCRTVDKNILEIQIHGHRMTDGITKEEVVGTETWHQVECDLQKSSQATALRSSTPEEKEADVAAKEVTESYCYQDKEGLLYCNEHAGQKTRCEINMLLPCLEVKMVLRGEESDQCRFVDDDDSFKIQIERMLAEGKRETEYWQKVVCQEQDSSDYERRLKKHIEQVNEMKQRADDEKSMEIQSELKNKIEVVDQEIDAPKLDRTYAEVVKGFKRLSKPSSE